MVKYGKKYREYQIEEWKDNYINYKLLKQKIKEIRRAIPDKKQTKLEKKILDINPILPDGKNNNFNYFESLYKLEYGNYLKEFVDLMNTEFHKFYIFFSNTEKQLYKEINTHLYTKENYSKFSKKDIRYELNSIGVSIYLAKCLNCFINDNLMAVKKILKKFDKKFSSYFGLITAKYVIGQLSASANDLDYLIQFKLIDEASVICENNAKILKELYDSDNVPETNVNENENESGKVEIQADFNQQYQEVLLCVKEIDEIVDFKMQYKEWFSFIKKGKKLVKNHPILLENDIYNPLMSYTNNRDSLVEKFLSTKEAFKQILDVQMSVSEYNETNMSLILIQKFFYNTLVTCMNPVIFSFIPIKNIIEKPTLQLSQIFISFAIEKLSFFCSLFFFRHAGNKIMLIISYTLCFFGSLFFIFCCGLAFTEGQDLPRFIYFALSRIFIGIGSNEIVGRKYIELYSPRFYLISISKKYTIVNFLGNACGPLFSFILFIIIPDKTFDKNYIYNIYNYMGWYGAVFSIFLLIISMIFFTLQYSEDFHMIRHESYIDASIAPSEEGSEKEKKKMIKKKKLKNKKNATKEKNRISTKKEKEPKKVENEEIKNDLNDNLLDDVININKLEEESNKNLEKDKKEKDVEEQASSSSTSVNACSNNIDSGMSSTILTTSQKKLINKIENKLDEFNTKSNFTNINLIPSNIETIIEYEQKSCGYIKRSLFIILIIFFLTGLLKENIVLTFSYHLKINEKLIFIRYEYVCLFLASIHSLEILSIYFVLPLDKINILFKKYIIIFMVSSIIFMIPISVQDLVNGSWVWIYFLCVLMIVISSSIIEILCSCFVSYLLPPESKFFYFDAEKLPIRIQVIGKIFGYLVCLFEMNSTESNINNPVLFGLTTVIYVFAIIYLLLSKEFRIKVISRMIKKKIYESMGI